MHQVTLARTSWQAQPPGFVERGTPSLVSPFGHPVGTSSTSRIQEHTFTSSTADSGRRGRFSSRGEEGLGAVLRLYRGENQEGPRTGLPGAGPREMAHRTPRLPDALAGPIGRMSREQTFGDRGRGAVEWVDRVGSPRSVSIHSRRAGRGLSWAIRNLGTERRSEPGGPSPRRRWRTSGRMAPPTRPGRLSPVRSIRARPPGV